MFHVQIELPAETWLETFMFIARPRIHTVVCFVGNYFSKVAHVRLHKRGKYTLGKLLIDTNKNAKNKNGRTEAQLWRKDGHDMVRVPFPGEVAMPGNIIGFEEIAISYIDGEVKDMLEKMRQLFINVNCLWLDFDGLDVGAPATCAIRMLKEISPLFGTVNLLQLPCSSVIAELDRALPSLLANATFLEVEDFYAPHTAAICDWLLNTDARSKIQKMMLMRAQECHILAIVNMLKEKFLAATRPAPFFARFCATLGQTLSAAVGGNSRQHNAVTDEDLLIQIPPNPRFAQDTSLSRTMWMSRHSRREVPGADWFRVRCDQFGAIHTTRSKRQLVIIRVEEDGENSIDLPPPVLGPSTSSNNESGGAGTSAERDDEESDLGDSDDDAVYNYMYLSDLSGDDNDDA